MKFTGSPKAQWRQIWSRWKIFEDKPLATAILDRLVGTGAEADIQSESYRLGQDRQLIEEIRRRWPPRPVSTYWPTVTVATKGDS